MKLSLLSIALLALTSAGIFAQSPSKEKPMSEEEARKAFTEVVESFGWTRQGHGTLGGHAKLEIPSGFRYTPPNGANKLLKLYGNPPSDSVLGLIAPEDMDWFAIFDFVPVAT